MLDINYHFLGSIPPKRAYSKMAIDEIYEYISHEAKLTITYNNIIIFAEEIAVVEFYWYISKWYEHCFTVHKKPFIYSTIEHSVPILTFNFHQNGFWEIDSIWKQCVKPVMVPEPLFLSTICKLINQFSSNIENEGYHTVYHSEG